MSPPPPSRMQRQRGVRAVEEAEHVRRRPSAATPRCRRPSTGPSSITPALLTSMSSPPSCSAAPLDERARARLVGDVDGDRVARRRRRPRSARPARRAGPRAARRAPPRRPRAASSSRRRLADARRRAGDRDLAALQRSRPSVPRPPAARSAQLDQHPHAEAGRALADVRRAPRPHAVPAMSTCTHGLSSTNWRRNSAA